MTIFDSISRLLYSNFYLELLDKNALFQTLKEKIIIASF